MKTVILCGGRGYRLKEETEFKPKPMITIGGKPILWHIMKIYTYFGFNEFIIALGYKGDYIKDYFLNQKYFAHNFTLYIKSGYAKIYRDHQGGKTVDDFKITFVDTGLDSLTGERVRRLRHYLKNERFMLTYGDGVSDVDIRAIVKFHQKKKVIGTITGVHPRMRWGIVRRDKDNLVTRFRQKPVLNEYVNGGFMVFEPAFFDYLRPNEMIEKALERLSKRRELAIYVYDGFWHMMDTYKDMDELNKMWEENAPWKVWR